MKELWNTAQVIFAAIGGWLGYFWAAATGCPSHWWYPWQWITSRA